MAYYSSGVLGANQAGYQPAFAGYPTYGAPAYSAAPFTAAPTATVTGTPTQQAPIASATPVTQQAYSTPAQTYATSAYGAPLGVSSAYGLPTVQSYVMPQQYGHHGYEHAMPQMPQQKKKSKTCCK